MKSAVPSHWKLTTTHWEAHRNWSSYNYTKSCSQFNPDQSVVLMEMLRNGKLRKLRKYVPHELTKKRKKKSHCFEASSLILCNNNEPFLEGTVTCDEKWVLYDNRWQPAQWLAWEEAPKHLSKSNLHQKNLIVTVWRSVVHLIWYSFLNPG